MPKYLIKANYTAEGMKGLQKDKASGREKAVAAACKGVGGKLDAIYYALGDDDAFVVSAEPRTRSLALRRGQRKRLGKHPDGASADGR